jgi:hypothetical protein
MNQVCGNYVILKLARKNELDTLLGFFIWSINLNDVYSVLFLIV